jgi:hypothetical protein
VVGPDGLNRRAELCFVLPSCPELDAVITVFVGREWSGEPREPEEMATDCFDIGSVPGRDDAG